MDAALAAIGRADALLQRTPTKIARSMAPHIRDMLTPQNAACICDAMHMIVDIYRTVFETQATMHLDAFYPRLQQTTRRFFMVRAMVILAFVDSILLRNIIACGDDTAYDAAARLFKGEELARMDDTERYLCGYFYLIYQDLHRITLSTRPLQMHNTAYVISRLIEHPGELDAAQISRRMRIIDNVNNNLSDDEWDFVLSAVA